MAKKIVEVYANRIIDESEESRKAYLDQVLACSAGRPEILRIHFLYGFGQIVDVLRKQTPLMDENLHFILETLNGRLQKTGVISDLITVFQESLNHLMVLTLKPLEGTQSIRLNGARQYIDANFKQDLKLEEVARRNGFSVSVFGRGFKKYVGMGFSAYLRKTRLEQAKKLLVSTSLSISQASQESGFNNLQYFFDVFKRATGKTPQAFRRSAKL